MITHIQIEYPDELARLVQTNLHDLVLDFRSRGIECNIQIFENKEQLAIALLNQAEGPEDDYKFPFSLGPK